MLRKYASLFMMLALVFGMSSAAFAQKSTVLRVIIVKTDNVTAYLAELDKGREMMKKLGVTPQLRVWQGTFAGTNAGSIVVTSEFSNLAELAADNAKLEADKDFGMWLKGLEKVRTITSDSIYRER